MADLPDDIHFLDQDQVQEIHLSQLDLHGGSAGLRDEGLLKSALSQPEASFGANGCTRTFMKWPPPTCLAWLAIIRSWMGINVLARLLPSFSYG